MHELVCVRKGEAEGCRAGVGSEGVGLGLGGHFQPGVSEGCPTIWVWELARGLTQGRCAAAGGRAWHQHAGPPASQQPLPGCRVGAGDQGQQLPPFRRFWKPLPAASLFCSWTPEGGGSAEKDPLGA